MRNWIDLITLNESFGGVINFDPQVDDTLFNLDLKARNGTLTPEDTKGFAAYLRDHKMDFIRMYHGTSSMHDVMGKGLLATSPGRTKSLQSAAGYVYVTYDPMSALTFAQMAYAGEYKSSRVVYAVDVTVKRLLPDHDQLFNRRMYAGETDIGATLADSMIHGRGARIKGKIDPMQIHVWGTFDRDGHRLD